MTMPKIQGIEVDMDKHHNELVIYIPNHASDRHSPFSEIGMISSGHDDDSVFVSYSSGSSARTEVANLQWFFKQN